MKILSAFNRKDGWLHEIRSQLSRGEEAVDHEALISEAFIRTVSRPPTRALPV